MVNEEEWDGVEAAVSAFEKETFEDDLSDVKIDD